MKLLRYIIAFEMAFSSCFAAYFDSITVFGGSYADVGMGFIISTSGPPNSPIPPTPPYYQGKFSDGPIYLEYLPSLIDADYPLLSMAVGGSTTGTGNAEDVNDVRGLGGVATQIERFQNTFQYINPKSLTILEAGLDNFILLKEQGLLTDPAQVVKGIETTISELKSDVKGIKQLGAHQIVLYTLPDPKTIPYIQNDPTTSLIMQGIVDAVNFDLKELPKTENQDVFIYDFYQIADDVLTEYAAAGGNITEHTLTVTSVDPYVVVQNGPSPDNLAYWDGIHFTTQIQGILANYLASVLNAPRSIGAQMDLAFLSTETQNDVLETRLANITRSLISCCQRPLCGFNFFFDVGGKWGRKNSKSRDFGFNFNTYHISGGVEAYIKDCLAAGILTSWIRNDGDLLRGNGKILLQDWATSLYGSYLKNCWGLDGQCTFHSYHINNKRSNLVFDRKARANVNGFGPEIGLKASYYMNASDWPYPIFAPFIAADYNYVHLNSYHEHGAGLLDLQMKHQWQNSLLAKIGLRMFSGDCSCFNYDFQIGYEHEFLRLERGQITPVFFDIENNKYLYTRNDPDRDFLRFLARSNLIYHENLVFTLEYIGKYGLNRCPQYNNSVQLEVTFIY